MCGAWGVVRRLALLLCMFGIAGALHNGVPFVWTHGEDPLQRRGTRSTHAADAGSCCPGIELPTARRPLPKRMAFVAGTLKSGTTFLFHELVSRHPRIRSQVVAKTTSKGRLKIAVKEAKYFDLEQPGSLDKYLKLFGDTRDSNATYLDATPSYLSTPAAAWRIAKIFPEARIVIVLKDPVARALSAWNMHSYKPDKDRVVGRFDKVIRTELMELQAMNCTFQPKAQAANQTGSSGSSSGGSGGSGSGSISRQMAGSSSSSNTDGRAAWARGPGIPSWTDCFRCIFEQGVEGYLDLGPDPLVPGTRRGWAARGAGLHAGGGERVDGAGQRAEQARDAGRKLGSNSTVAGSSSSSSSSSSREHVTVRRMIRGHIIRSLYVYQLEMWLQYFPPDQLLVINYEELKHNPEDVVDRVITFLGQDTGLKALPNATEMPLLLFKTASLKSKKTKGFTAAHQDNEGKLYGDVMARLYRFFQHPNHELYRLLASLGPNIGWKGDFPTSFKEYKLRHA